VTRDHLELLVDYHYWARDRMLDAVGALPAREYLAARGGSFASIRDTVVHIYGAEWIWMQRWKGTSPTAGVGADRFPDLSSLRTAWLELEREVRAYVRTLEGARAEERVVYRNLAGREADSSRWTMVQHLVNHASYHRGQVTTLVRQAGGQSAPQDLSAYYREKGI